MKRLQAYKFELRPDGEQEQDMRRFAGSCRFVFNRALALQKALREQGEKKLSYAEMCKALTEWKTQPEASWLEQIHSQVLQQSIKDLDRAYKNFFEKRADFPRFKKRGQRDSFRFPQGCKLEQLNSRVFLPKIGWLRYRNSRDVLGKVKNVTISHCAGKWFASIQTEREVEQPVHSSDSIVGVDMGVARLATLSDGKVFEPVNSFRRHQQRLACHQRAMARRQKFSNNWRKTKAKVTKLHQKISNVRLDYLHKATTTISKNHAIVCIEDLQVRNMSKSAAGTKQKPGRNVRAKSGLNRSILDQGWFEFRRQLEYKQAWSGGEVIAVAPHNTSRTCPRCNHVSKDNRKTQAQFVCMECGFKENADLVGAINVLRAGHARIACGDTSPGVRASAQEPSEAIQAFA